jgi:SAM-dependent methyltransferase
MASQQWSANDYARHARFVTDLGSSLFELLDPKPGERILDLGCGDGVLTAKIAAAGASVVGLDASDDMLAKARALGLEVREMHGERLEFDNEFGAIFSNAALHWMRDADAVVAGTYRALRPGGRFIGEFGGHGNVAAISVALIAVLARRGVDGLAHFPWYFPSAEEYGAKLSATGFTVKYIELIPRPTPLPTDMEGWLATFGNPFFALLPEGERQPALAEVVSLLRPFLCDAAGRWTADYVRLRFAAEKQA